LYWAVVGCRVVGEGMKGGGRQGSAVVAKCCRVEGVRWGHQAGTTPWEAVHVL
jgi:hypothetical protein